VAVDLSAADGPAQLIQRAIEQHGHLDVLVNNVGAVRMRTEGFLGTSDEDFAWAMEMNFFIALRASRAAITAMVERGGGAIVNVASVNAFFQPDAATIDYGAAKAALVNLTKTLAQEFGAQGIRVNAVSPGPVATDLWLGEHGVAQTVAKATGVDADTARREHHRCQLHHRRRPDQDNLTSAASSSRCLDRTGKTPAGSLAPQPAVAGGPARHQTAAETAGITCSGGSQCVHGQ
jgi:NAD(P)-dependent dehydrogenase (short-subunit alcohol dehydrogenase family)